MGQTTNILIPITQENNDYKAPKQDLHSRISLFKTLNWAYFMKLKSNRFQCLKREKNTYVFKLDATQCFTRHNGSMPVVKFSTCCFLIGLLPLSYQSLYHLSFNL